MIGIEHFGFAYLKMYAIYSVERGCFFNIITKKWVDSLNGGGGCLFPTLELAEEYLKSVDADAKVYLVEIESDNYRYLPVD